MTAQTYMTDDWIVENREDGRHITIAAQEALHAMPSADWAYYRLSATAPSSTGGVPVNPVLVFEVEGQEAAHVMLRGRAGVVEVAEKNRAAVEAMLVKNGKTLEAGSIADAVKAAVKKL